MLDNVFPLLFPISQYPYITLNIIHHTNHSNSIAGNKLNADSHMLEIEKAKNSMLFLLESKCSLFVIFPFIFYMSFLDVKYILEIFLEVFYKDFEFNWMVHSCDSEVILN